MAKRTVYHVVPNDDKWGVKREGAERSSNNCNTQKEAIEKARDYAKNSGLGQVKIHGEDGRIREERTYGDDPYPPKG